MTWSSLFLLSVALATASATPGPTTTALVSRVAAQGLSGSTWFCAGLIAGDLFWLLCATLGLAALVAAAGPAFTVIRLLGAAYLLYVAWQLWTAGLVVAKSASPEIQRKQLAIAGLSLALGNPKTMLFYLALVPALLPLETVKLIDVVVLSLLVLAIYGMVLCSYALLAAQARRFLSSSGPRVVVNRISSVVIAATAFLIALR